MTEYHVEKLANQIRELAAEFLGRESNRQSLITVTSVRLFDHNKTATVYVTVLPESKEEAALDFLKRQRSDFKAYVKENSRIGLIPFFDFAIDEGEKNRQRIDQLINEDARKIRPDVDKETKDGIE